MDSINRKFTEDLILGIDAAFNTIHVSDPILPELDLPILCTPLQPVATVAPTEEEDKICCICMDTMTVSRSSTLKCSHTFHTDCILENIAAADTNKNMCPLCRSEMCSAISCPETDELKDELDALENTLEDNKQELDDYKMAVLYFHDEAEYKKNLLLTKDWIDDRDVMYEASLRRALLRTQSKLSAEIVKNESVHRYKKCGVCRCYGHNRATCMRRDKNELLDGFEPNYEYEFRTPRPSGEIFLDIREGYLYSLIQNHFED